MVMRWLMDPIHKVAWHWRSYTWLFPVLAFTFGQKRRRREFEHELEHEMGPYVKPVYAYIAEPKKIHPKAYDLWRYGANNCSFFANAQCRDSYYTGQRYEPFVEPYDYRKKWEGKLESWNLIRYNEKIFPTNIL